VQAVHFIQQLLYYFPDGQQPQQRS
jgi:hypothetical protein